MALNVLASFHITPAVPTTWDVLAGLRPERACLPHDDGVHLTSAGVAYSFSCRDGRR
jgi:hypothetical protein